MPKKPPAQAPIDPSDRTMPTETLHNRDLELQVAARRYSSSSGADQLRDLRSAAIAYADARAHINENTPDIEDE